MNAIHKLTFWATGGWFTMIWVGVGTAVVGAGASIYGANKQSQAIKSAANQNAESQAEQNRSAWANYLMTRGIAPTGVATGQLPSNPQAINTRLPLWANANFSTGKTGWVRKGTAPNTLNMAPTYTGVDPSTGMASPTNNGSRSVVRNLLDPGGLTDGKMSPKDVLKHGLDPLNLFCWVAREIYGEDNPKWMQFRDWLLTKAPSVLRESYRNNGALMADRIRKSAKLRQNVKAIMDQIFESEIYQKA